MKHAVFFIALLCLSIAPCGSLHAAGNKKEKKPVKASAAGKAKKKGKGKEKVMSLKKVKKDAAKKAEEEEAAEPEAAADQGLIDLGFRHAIFECVKDRIYPPAINVKVYIRSDGTMQLTSIKPRPNLKVYNCISTAASKVKMDPAEGMGDEEYPVLLPYPYEAVGDGWGEPRPIPKEPPPFVMEPPPKYVEYPPPPREPPKKPPKPPKKRYKYPRRKDGGLGIYTSFVLLDRGKNTWEYEDASDAVSEIYNQLNGGLGLYIEALARKRVFVGLELNFSFPRVNHIKNEGGSKTACTTCELDIFVRLLLRMKVPFMASGKTAFYPVFLFGYSDYISRAQGRDKLDSHGVTLGFGFGFEILKIRVFSPFIEVRYMYHYGLQLQETEDDDGVQSSKQKLHNHNLGLMLGVRIP